MLRKKTEQQTVANPLKTQQQLSFESQWKAEESKAEPATSSKPMIASVSEKFVDDEFNDLGRGQFASQLSFDSASFNTNVLESFDQQFSAPFGSRSGIPGLDIAPELEAEVEEEDEPMDIIDLDDEQDYLPDDKSFLSDPPPMPNFKKPKRLVVMIGELLNKPGRDRRPNK
jgi:hypothetical protein